MFKTGKQIALLLACMMIFTLFGTACGSSGGNDLSVKDAASTSSSVATDKTSTPDTNATVSTNTDGVKKKIVVVKEDDDDLRNQLQSTILTTLDSSGFNNNNSEITEIKMQGNDKSSSDVINKIKSIKLDVVIINQSYFAADTVAKPLMGSTIPVVLTYSTESNSFVDENNIPKSNITGIYTMPKDMLSKGFEFLQDKISPSKGKKAVFISVDGFDSLFSKDKVEKALNSVGVELKDYCVSKYVEDFQTSVEKYNNDDDVAWILVGIWPSVRKDGAKWDMLATGKWDRENRTKPTITFWDVGVQNGILCGLAVDLTSNAKQATEMAVKILRGEHIKDIKAEDPAKMNIVLNQKRAEYLGIQFSAEVLGSSKIYKDYDGHILK